MEFVFPMQAAVQCIPEFSGNSDELDTFINQAEFFAHQIPLANQNNITLDTSRLPETYLVNVVLMKLKGGAGKIARRLRAKTWHETRANLYREFADRTTIEEVVNQIETLRQREYESFESYRNRALFLQYNMKAFLISNATFSERFLTMHFLTGLCEPELKKIGFSYRKKPFAELVECIRDEIKQREQISILSERVRLVHEHTQSGSIHRGDEKSWRSSSIGDNNSFTVSQKDSSIRNISQTQQNFVSSNFVKSKNYSKDNRNIHSQRNSSSDIYEPTRQSNNSFSKQSEAAKHVHTKRIYEEPGEFELLNTSDDFNALDVTEKDVRINEEIIETNEINPINSTVTVLITKNLDNEKVGLEVGNEVEKLIPEKVNLVYEKIEVAAKKAIMQQSKSMDAKEMMVLKNTIEEGEGTFLRQTQGKVLHILNLAIKIRNGMNTHGWVGQYIF